MLVNKKGNEHAVRFQIDTGSECDVLPLALYKQVTGDDDLQKLRPCKKVIVSYTGQRRNITGKANISVWLGDQKKTLNFNIIDGNYQPVLSLQSCINLGLVKLRDCEILAITATRVDGILEEYKDVFEGLGELPGEYKIITDDSMQPKVHPPRRVPVALRPRIKATSLHLYPSLQNGCRVC